MAMDNDYRIEEFKVIWDQLNEQSRKRLYLFLKFLYLQERYPVLRIIPKGLVSKITASWGVRN